ncbi:uncharacterized protein TNCV_4131331 [Trichonephila clavipes]|nr:uncharacterized protein TNCV_4131331 [Trichonephila clavipes]
MHLSAQWLRILGWAQFGSCEYSPNRPNQSGLRLSRGYSKVILDQLPNEQETAVRTDVESRNHVEAIPAQIEAYNLVALHFKYDQARRRFVEWTQNEIAVVPDFHKRILCSDEAHFWLNGYVNKQNCRIWSEANPQVYVETPLHPEKLTVSCALWAGGILLQKR